MAAKKRCADKCVHVGGESWHGYVGYKYHGCDCFACMNAWREADRARYKKNPSARMKCSINCIHTGKEEWHGTENGASRHKCKCQPCMDAINEAVRKRSLKKRQFIDSTKLKPCLDCGDDTLPVYAKDYDHRDPSDKSFALSKYQSKSIQAIKDEISKCDLLCANCHRVRTWPDQTRNIFNINNKQSIVAIGKDKPCMDCGIKYQLCAMDYDHRDPSTKLFHVSQTANHSMQEIVEEISKCDVVCANCHRIRTFKNK